MRSPIPSPALLLILAGTATACAPQHAPNPFGATSSAEFDPTKILPNEISREEIDSRGRNYLTAMALIRRLRPGWLIARGQDSLVDGSSSYPVVYIDEIRHGGLPTLNRIPASEIQRMEFFSTADATTRWGTGHPSGAINVVTGRL
jgi:hypothetical protein